MNSGVNHAMPPYDFQPELSTSANCDRPWEFGRYPGGTLVHLSKGTLVTQGGVPRRVFSDAAEESPDVRQNIAAVDEVAMSIRPAPVDN